MESLSFPVLSKLTIRLRQQKEEGEEEE